MGEPSHDSALSWSRGAPPFHGQCRLFRHPRCVEGRAQSVGCRRGTSATEPSNPRTHSRELRGSHRNEIESSPKRGGKELLYLNMNLGLFLFFSFYSFLSLSFPPLIMPQTDSLFRYENVGSLYVRMWNLYSTPILIAASHYISESVTSHDFCYFIKRPKLHVRFSMRDFIGSSNNVITSVGERPCDVQLDFLYQEICSWSDGPFPIPCHSRNL